MTGYVSDAEIAKGFGESNFGPVDHRELLALSVFKKALKYHCGHTITQIMVDMKLTTAKGSVTEKGRRFCYEELRGDRGG